MSQQEQDVNWDFLAQLSQVSVAQPSQPALPLSSSSSRDPPGHGKNYYDCSSMDGNRGVSFSYKSRMACLRFDKAQTPNYEGIVKMRDRIYENLTSTVQLLHGSYGLSLRCMSFFVLDEQLWFVIVAKSAHYLSKWHRVQVGIGAVETRVYNQGNEKPRNSICSVCEIFPGVTQEELLFNYYSHIQDRQAARAAKVPANPAKRNLELEKESSNPPLLSPPAKRRAKERTPIAMVALPVVETVFNVLAKQCQQFLADPELGAAGCHAHEQALRRYLEIPGHRGQMGLYLLDGGLNGLYAQTVYLKEVVLNVLSTRFGMSVAHLSSKDITADPSFASMDPASRVAIMRIAEFDDGIKSVLTFAMYDPLSILVFLSVYILRCHRETKGRADFEAKCFLHSEAHIIGEVSISFSPP